MLQTWQHRRVVCFIIYVPDFVLTFDTFSNTVHVHLVTLKLIKMASIKALEERIKQLEDELSRERSQKGGRVREKIETMSSEVVDSNPYR